jgi:RNA recognition motif. (a.k.a. RRM, RBD, or RNP domain)
LSFVTALTCAAGAQQQLVRQAVGHYGNIVSVTVPEAKEFCFVEFEDESQAQVIPLNYSIYIMINTLQHAPHTLQIVVR